jgi:GNAT superfamily N-acetyltransferase
VPTIPLDLDGYTDLPPGRIANVVTYLEMRTPPPPRLSQGDGGLVLRPIAAPALAWYRDIYRRIGERWLWFSRAVMDDRALAARLADPATAILALERDHETIGFAELNRSVEGEIEIAMFGVVPEATGTGAARFLMDEVLALAWVPGTRRVWLHTCTFDHPAAIPFYRRAGFVPWKFAIEVSPDPRLTGELPRHAGPHVPLIEPGGNRP